MTLSTFFKEYAPVVHIPVPKDSDQIKVEIMPKKGGTLLTQAFKFKDLMDNHPEITELPVNVYCSATKTISVWR